MTKTFPQICWKLAFARGRLNLLFFRTTSKTAKPQWFTQPNPVYTILRLRSSIYDGNFCHQFIPPNVYFLFTILRKFHYYHYQEHDNLLAILLKLSEWKILMKFSNQKKLTIFAYIRMKRITKLVYRRNLQTSYLFFSSSLNSYRFFVLPICINYVLRWQLFH